MKNKGIIILSSILIIGITAFSFSTNKTSKDINNNSLKIDSNSVTKKLSDFGISGGINIDYRTGKATQLTSSKPELSYTITRGSISPNALVRTGRAITEEKLRNAQTIRDLIENYPSNWITAYNSVTVVTKVNGETIEAQGPNDKLTNEQKNIFKYATNLLLVVQYQKENNKNEVQNRQMNVSLVVTPETEAEYNGGYEEMIHYLKVNSLKKINAKDFDYSLQPTISFVVNQEGKTENIKLETTSEDNEIDQLLLKLIAKMPNWNPAKNKEGKAIKQEFLLSIGQDGC